MTALQHLAAGRHYTVHLPEPDDFDLWRERARALAADARTWFQNHPRDEEQATAEEIERWMASACGPETEPR